MDIYLSEAVKRKLKEKHGVTLKEVTECFQNLKTKFAYDTREYHQSNPPTLWFIGLTDTGRQLKVVFQRYSKLEVVLKSAYEPNADEVRLYNLYRSRG